MSTIQHSIGSAPVQIAKPRFALVNKIAEEILEKFENPLPPIDLNVIVKEYGWKVLYDELKGPDGYMIKFGPRFGIFIATDMDKENYNERIVERRQIWTLAHEIGHIVLHGDYVLNSQEVPNALDEVTAKHMEIEANWFAARLLMPDYVFEDPSDLNPYHLAEKCNVNYSAATKRVEKLDDTVLSRVFSQLEEYVIPLPKFVDANMDHFEEPKFILEEIDNDLSLRLDQPVSSPIQFLYDCHEQVAVEVEMSSQYNVYPTDESDRFYSCIQCGNTEFSEHAAFCKICGYSLYNICTSESHSCSGQRTPSDARHCEVCGSETLLLKHGIIKNWLDLMSEYFDISYALKSREEKGQLNIFDRKPNLRRG